MTRTEARVILMQYGIGDNIKTEPVDVLDIQCAFDNGMIDNHEAWMWRIARVFGIDKGPVRDLSDADKLALLKRLERPVEALMVMQP